MLNNKINRAIPIVSYAPTLNEFVAKRPKLMRIEALKVVLLYKEYLIDNHQDIVLDTPDLATFGL